MLVNLIHVEDPFANPFLISTGKLIVVLLPQQRTKVNRLAFWSGGSGAGMQSRCQLLCGCIGLYSIIEFHNRYIIVIELYCDGHNRPFSHLCTC